jgi:phage terminase large subunit-like protein
MTIAVLRPEHAFARGLDLSDPRDVARAVAIYADIHGRTFDRFHFDEQQAANGILFFPRYTRLTKGTSFAGRPFTLSPWQAFDIVAPVWGWRCEDGTRRYRRGSVWVPRKNGKTELMAGMALAHLFCDGEQGGEGYAVATKEDQARIVFDAAKRMVAMSPPLMAESRVFKDAIWCDALASSFKPLGGKAEGSHGKGPSFRIADELHEFRDDRLLQFLDQGTGARAQPMAWDISTAGLQEGYGWELWNACRNLADGTIEDHRSLVAIYAADEDDDPYDEATWIKANPNYGVSLSPEYMRDQAELAKRSTRHENDFKRYHLNLWVGQVKRWIKIERWDACAREADWKEKRARFRGRPGWIGVDLSSTQDLCSEAIVFPPAGSDPNWQSIQRTWLPDADLIDRIRDSRVPFDRWAEQGAITLTPGDAADHETIERQIREDFEAYDIKAAGFDPWNAHAMMTSLKADFGDERIRKVSQTIAGMNSGCKLLERLVLTGRLDHGRDPVLRWCAGNVEIAQDGNGNIKPMKRKGHQKIDPLVATINALTVSQGEEPENNVPSLEVFTL